MQVGLAPKSTEELGSQGETARVVPPNDVSEMGPPTFGLPGLSEEQNRTLVRQITELAATAAAVAARDATKGSRKVSGVAPATAVSSHSKLPGPAGSGYLEEIEEHAGFVDPQHSSSGGGHDAPNWGKTKSSAILLLATLAYALIAEILVYTVDTVLESVDIDEKFLGITLFALVPNTTEFLVSTALPFSQTAGC
jgi:Ca2+:H+ antiporter